LDQTSPMEPIHPSCRGPRRAMPKSQQSEASDTIGKAKDRDGTPPDQQRAIYAGNQREDCRTARDYIIQKVSVHHVMSRLRGGMLMFVIAFAGCIVSQGVGASHSTDNVKVVVREDKEGIPHGQPRWTTAGNQREDGRTASDPMTQKESTLHLVPRERGGTQAYARAETASARRIPCTSACRARAAACGRSPTPNGLAAVLEVPADGIAQNVACAFLYESPRMDPSERKNRRELNNLPDALKSDQVVIFVEADTVASDVSQLPPEVQQRPTAPPSTICPAPSLRGLPAGPRWEEVRRTLPHMTCEWLSFHCESASARRTPCTSACRACAAARRCSSTPNGPAAVLKVPADGIAQTGARAFIDESSHLNPSERRKSRKPNNLLGALKVNQIVIFAMTALVHIAVARVLRADLRMPEFPNAVHDNRCRQDLNSRWQAANRLHEGGGGVTGAAARRGKWLLRAGGGALCERAPRRGSAGKSAHR